MIRSSYKDFMHPASDPIRLVKTSLEIHARININKQFALYEK